MRRLDWASILFPGWGSCRPEAIHTFLHDCLMIICTFPLALSQLYMMAS